MQGIAAAPVKKSNGPPKLSIAQRIAAVNKANALKKA
jgi:hypothetical protein